PVRPPPTVLGIDDDRLDLPRDEKLVAAAGSERNGAAVPDGAAFVEHEDVRGPAERVPDELVAHELERRVLRVDDAVELVDPAEPLLVERPSNSLDVDAHASRPLNQRSRSLTEANHAPRSTPYSITCRKSAR